MSIDKPIFQVELPIPPDLPPSTSYTNTTTRKSIDFYEINIHAFERQTYPGLNTTTYVGYNGIAPGPTLRMTKGREAVVRFVNNYDRNSSIHLHGSYSRTPFDGWAEDVTGPGEYKDYYYPNAQPVRTLWYHDHALGITAINAYFGQAGFYILEDQAVSDRLGLPTGKYDIPLMLAGKQFLASGKLKSPEDERVSLYGDVITVNAQPWPYLKVEPRKYKFRLLDASISRTFSLYLVEDSKPKLPLTFTVVGAGAGYTDHP
jgi:bilirubin oxidase